ncbi:hypothetical protein CJ179_38265 [Rhodococcus sp. ACS1]|nr:hypothetical protein CJ179_38265 [Rhodococcus sp. ACS1]
MLVETIQTSNTAGVSTSISAQLPPNRAIGDLMVIIGSNYNGSITVPSGWTLIDQSTGTRQRVGAIYRVCTGGEGSTVSITFGGSADSIAVSALLFRNQHATTPINASDNGGVTISSTTHTTPSVTTTSAATANEAILIRAATTYIDGIGPGTNYTWSADNMTEIVDFVASTSGDSTNAALGVAMRTLTTVGSQGTAVATSATNRAYGTLTFAIAPAP